MQHTHPKVYLKITKLLGTPTVDLFVSRIYHERSYMTWKPDPNSFATDAERLAQNVCFCIPTFQLDSSLTKNVHTTSIAFTSPHKPITKSPGRKTSSSEIQVIKIRGVENRRNFKQCNQTYLHLQKTRFNCRLRIGLEQVG